MRFLRYLLYAFIQLGVIGGGLWLYSVVRGLSFLEINFFSGGLLTLLGFSFVPLIEMILRQRKLPIANLSGIRSKLFMLECTFAGNADGTIDQVKTKLREICDTTVLDDRVFVLVDETANSLEYETEPRLDELGSTRKKKRFEQARIEMKLEDKDRVNSVQVQVCSSTDSHYIGVDNIENEENVAVIVMGLQDAGLLRPTERKGLLRGRDSRTTNHGMWRM